MTEQDRQADTIELDALAADETARESAPSASVAAAAQPKPIMIARPGDRSQRIFPAIGPELYDLGAEPPDLTPDQRAARRILALAQRTLTPRQRLLGWQLDAIGRVGCLLLLHQLALRAELAAQWHRADFFWREVHAALRAISPRADQPEQHGPRALARQDDVWQALAAFVADEPGVEVMRDPIQMRQRLVDELLIDTHCAFYNGRTQAVETPALGDRRFVHIDYIKGLLDLSALTDAATLDMLATPLETQITLCEAAKRWQQAIDLVTELLSYSPDRVEYQERLAKLHFSITLADLRNRTAEEVNLKDARTLERGINRLEDIRKDYPHNIAIYQLLGHLYHLQANKLANGNSLAHALVAAQQAIVFYPGLEEAQKTMTELAAAMPKLQARMKAITAELAQRRNAHLNAQGIRMRDAASLGFKLVNQYANSADAKATVEARRIAYAHDVWRRIGLAEPATEQWNQQAITLLDTLSSIFNNPPPDAASVTAAWDAAAAQNADLADLDPAPICTFLKQRIFGEPGSDTPAAPTPAQPDDPPILQAVSARRQRGDEPFGYWLFSRRDTPLKLLAAAAIVIALLAGGLTAREVLARQARDTAYQQVVAASETQDYLGVIEGAEDFFSSRPVSGKDQHDQEVRDLYSDALVHWVTAQKEVIDAEASAHIDRYRTLIVNSQR